jgi:ribA/ribD-fused uncharacterized protein
MKTDKFVFFYGGEFSQWYPSYFVVDGITYETAEQYMMAMKAEYFGDEEAKAKIMATSNPSAQKAIGRTVSNFDAEAWNAVSRGYVYKGNMAKFGQDLSLKRVLLATEERELVEASPYDRIWGIGLGLWGTDPKHTEKLLDKTQWRGTNWLGETLMKVRKDLRESDNRL